MNIIIFSKHFYPENFKINHIANYFSKNHNVTVITGNNTHTDRKKYFSKFKKYKYKNVEVYSFPVFVKKKNNFINIFFDYFFYCLLLSLNIIKLKNFRCDIIFTYGTSPIFQAIPAILLAKLLRVPSLLWVQDLWPEVLVDTGYIKNKSILTIINFFVKKIYLLTDIILAQSKSFQTHLIKNYNLKHLSVVHQPADFLFQRYNLKKNKNFIITYAGNFGLAQDFETILNAFKSGLISQNIQLQLIGSGKKYNYISDFIVKNKLSNIKIIDHMSEVKIQKFLYNSDAFFISLKSGDSLNKTLPGKFQTYISFGKPILSVSPGYISKFIIKNKIGLSSLPGDIKKLTLNIDKLSKLSFFEKKNIYRRCKKLYFLYFDIHKVSTQILSIMNKADVKKNLL